MKYEDLPNRWKDKHAEYLRSNGGVDKKKLDICDFDKSQTIRIKFEDESYAKFRYALIIEVPEFKETGLFTEHCGYHIFNTAGIEIELIEELND